MFCYRTHIENNSSKKWEQIYMGVKRGSKLPNIFEPLFPHREVMEGLGLLASQCKWSWPVWKFSAGFPVICIVRGGGGGVLWDYLPALSALASDTSINPQPRAVRHLLDLEGKFISLAD